jgi:hypothetical protein
MNATIAAHPDFPPGRASSKGFWCKRWVGLIISGMNQLLPHAWSPFHGRHFDRTIIILCVGWYITYKLSYRDSGGMMAERGVEVSHTDDPRMGSTLRAGVREALELLRASGQHIMSCG